MRGNQFIFALPLFAIMASAPAFANPANSDDNPYHTNVTQNGSQITITTDTLPYEWFFTRNFIDKKKTELRFLVWIHATKCSQQVLIDLSSYRDGEFKRVGNRFNPSLYWTITL